MYRITTTKTIGGSSVSVPMVTIDKRSQAIEYMKDLVRAEAEEMNAEAVGLVGGTVKIMCEKCKSMFDDAQDVIAYAAITRPINSPECDVLWGE